MQSSLPESLRLNAAASYGFIGWIFLLSHDNSTFSHPYLRSHARRSVMIDGAFIAIFSLFYFAIKPLLAGWYLPIIPIAIDRILGALIFLAFALLIAFVAYRAYLGYEADAVLPHSLQDSLGAMGAHSEHSGDVKTTLIALTPFLGQILALRMRDRFTLQYASLGAIMSVILVWALTRGGSTAPLFLISIVYIASMVWIAVNSLANWGSVTMPAWMHPLPGVGEWYPIVRAVIRFTFTTISGIFRPHPDALSFRTLLTQEIERERSDRTFETMSSPAVRLIIPAWLLALPVVSLIAVMPALRSTWRMVGFQSLVMNILFLTHALYVGFHAPELMWWMFPLVWSLGHILAGHTRYRLPIIAEIVAITASLVVRITRVRHQMTPHRDAKSLTLRVDGSVSAPPSPPDL